MAEKAYINVIPPDRDYTEAERLELIKHIMLKVNSKSWTDWKAANKIIEAIAFNRKCPSSSNRLMIKVKADKMLWEKVKDFTGIRANQVIKEHIVKKTQEGYETYRWSWEDDPNWFITLMNNNGEFVDPDGRIVSTPIEITGKSTYTQIYAMRDWSSIEN